MTAAPPRTPPLADLYLADETAWLDATAAQIRAGDLRVLDYGHLAEFLEDMAKRDKREVFSRLVVLLAHVLKWQAQPEKRSGGWSATIYLQQREIARDVASGVLRAYALAELANAFADAVVAAARETGLPESTFPAECPFTLDQLLAFTPADDARPGTEPGGTNPANSAG